MATKDVDESKKKVKEVAVEQTQLEPRQQQQPVGPVVAEKAVTKKNQTVITIAIVSGIVLFFVGFGLGYALGHTTTGFDSDFRGGNLQSPGDGNGRQFYPNSGTNNSTNGGSSSTTTPQTQTN